MDLEFAVFVSHTLSYISTCPAAIASNNNGKELAKWVNVYIQFACDLGMIPMFAHWT